MSPSVCRTVLWLLVVVAFDPSIHAQSNAGAPAKIIVDLDRKDWTYKVGDTPVFRVRTEPPSEDGAPEVVRYRLGQVMFEPEIPVRLEVPPGGVDVPGGTMEHPGFRRLIADVQVGNKKVRGLATAAFSPEEIRPTQTEPADFDAFWKESLEKLVTVTADPRLEHRPERSGPTFDAYELSLATYDPNGKTDRFYGILCVPKGSGPFPAILQTPGAGVRGYKGEIWVPRDQFITLEVGIHGIPVTKDADYYKALFAGALSGYERRDLADREKFYYRRVYLGCYRALDYLTSHPKWDGRNLIVRGGSQGGQLAIVCGALHPKVTGIAAAFPAFCDVTGYLHGRAGGWPGLFRGKPPEDPEKRKIWDAEIATTAYYDAVNFARRLNVPAYFTWGFNDEVCPPDSFYAMLGVVTAPREVRTFPLAGHDLPQEGWGAYSAWTIKQARAH